MPRKGAFVIVLIACLATGLWIIHPQQAGQKWQLADVTGHLPDLRFSLIADNGRPVSDEAYRGDIVLLYFGYTGCPGQCPATLTRLNQIQRAWHERMPLQILFVSITPAADTPRVLHQYLASFDAGPVTGLTGSPDAIETLARRYRAAYRPVSGGGEIVHGALTYVFDPHGRARLLMTPEDSDKSVLSNLRRLAHETP